MLIMIIGLFLFLGAHSVRIVAEDWRNRQISQRNESVWMGIVSIISLLGFVLLIWGYSQARIEPTIIWQPPLWTRHLAAVLTLPAIILLVAAYVPGTKIKTMVGHPMILGVKLWALAHILANGTLTDIILFGSFLIWAVLDYRASKRRDKATGNKYLSVGISRDIIAVTVGVISWAIFALILHKWLMGVAPF